MRGFHAPFHHQTIHSGHCCPPLYRPHCKPCLMRVALGTRRRLCALAYPLRLARRNSAIEACKSSPSAYSLRSDCLSARISLLHPSATQLARSNGHVGPPLVRQHAAQQRSTHECSDWRCATTDASCRAVVQRAAMRGTLIVHFLRRVTYSPRIFLLGACEA